MISDSSSLTQDFICNLVVGEIQKSSRLSIQIVGMFITCKYITLLDTRTKKRSASYANVSLGRLIMVSQKIQELNESSAYG